MITDEEIKAEISDSGRLSDEIISIHEVCLDDKFDRQFFGFNGEAVLPTPGKNDLDVSRFLGECLDIEVDSESILPDPGMPFKYLDVEVEVSREAEALSHKNRAGVTFMKKSTSESNVVSSTSNNSLLDMGKKKQPNFKVDADDPRSRFHYVKYLKRQGRTAKLWECGICGREFQHQYTLMRHLPTHTDERNFHCDVCDKSFRQLSTLSQHKAIHSADRPYSCEVCSKTFNRVSTLISHRKTHSGSKPYRCYLCPKGFHQKGNLRNHLFTHTNERPYRCSVCLKGFNQQSNLVCHQNKAHPEDGIPVMNERRQVPSRKPATQTRPDSTKQDNCEVTSSNVPYLPPKEGPSTISWNPTPTIPPIPTPTLPPRPTPPTPNGVVVDQIKTYHMGVARAMKQTPFALLKTDNTPVLVKVFDTLFSNGKQLLVPATAEDLRTGGKIVQNKDGSSNVTKGSTQEGKSAVQITVPVVAVVTPKVRGGRLLLAVEEPHNAYHTALSADGGEVKVEPCMIPSSGNRPVFQPQLQRQSQPLTMKPSASGAPKRTQPPSLQPPPPPPQSCPDFRHGARISPSCSLPPPAPSPPLDLISLDLFEPIDCIPMGPQVVPVGNVNPPPSDESDVFIYSFEDSIQLSD